jgi:WhiB family transcriptional regulator, redox-sensing transcriptional regulator
LTGTYLKHVISYVSFRCSVASTTAVRHGGRLHQEPDRSKEASHVEEWEELNLLLGVDEEASWQERALCAQTDPEAFFPEKGGSTREAKRVCLSCEVQSECLEYALENDERFGIWGGLSERERRKLKRRAV